MYALNPDGSLKWSYQTAGWIYDCSPALSLDGTIYFGSESSSVSHLCALNSSGSLKWRYSKHQAYFSSPAVGADGSVYLGGQDEALALRPDGSVKWRRTLGVMYETPAIGADGSVYFGVYTSDSSCLFALDSNGVERWHYRVGMFAGSPCIGPDGTAYFVSGDTNIHAVGLDGALKWSCRMGVSSETPAIGSDGILYVGAKPTCNDSRVFAINPDGTPEWDLQVGDGYLSSPAIGPDSVVYIGSYDGYLYAIQGSAPLASSPWPKFHHDNQNTGRAGQ